MMPRIFISYRRSDSQDIAGRIYDRLVEAFGDESVFMDVEGIQPGTSWRGKLRQAVTDSNVLLVLIGSTWLDTLKSRQSDPDDWVRYEIQMGLENDGTLVIPVLLQDTRMPSKSDLPDVIEDLVDSQSIKVRSGSDFRRDMDELITFLRGLDQPASTPSTQSQPTNAKSGIRTEVLVAIITGFFVVIAAAIGILPNLLNPQPTPTSAAAISTLTVTPSPPTETPTTTPAPPTNTDTPQPSDTPTPTEAPPTNTDQPTSAPIPLVINPLIVQRGENLTINTSANATCTFISSNGDRNSYTTQTGTFPWRTENYLAGARIDVYCEKEGTRSETVTFQVGTLTNTPNPPTNTPVPTIPAASANTITLTIFRDQDSLTLYMPKTDQPLSLAEFIFQVEIAGQNRQFPILSYSSFGGNSILGNVSILNSAACFRLIRSGSNNPAPLQCQSGALPLTQNVTDADVFWYDSTANQHRTVLVMRDGNTITVCAAGQTRCDMELSVAVEVVSVAAASTATPGYPCEGTIVFSSGGLLNQVRVSPLRNAPPVSPVQQGSTVSILARQSEGGSFWYQINYSDNINKGWIPSQYVVISEHCPNLSN